MVQRVDFSYEYIDFFPEGYLVAELDKFYSIAVASKINGGRSVAPGTWTYTYEPGFEFRAQFPMDRTTVNAPGGKTVYIHNGIKVQSAAYFPVFSLIGKLVEKTYF